MLKVGAFKAVSREQLLSATVDIRGVIDYHLDRLMLARMAGEAGCRFSHGIGHEFGREFGTNPQLAWAMVDEFLAGRRAFLGPPEREPVSS